MENLFKSTCFYVKILNRLFEKIRKLFATVSFFIWNGSKVVFERWKIILNRYDSVLKFLIDYLKEI